MSTTSLPAPTAAAFVGDRWPHMHELRRELAALVADLEPVRTTRGPGASDEAARLVRRGWRRIFVRVYAPAGRDEVALGWFPRERVQEVVARLLEHLPGLREADEPLVRGSVMLDWGSRTEGWTPTAIRVRRGFMHLIAWREPDELWTAKQCAEHCQISVDTWNAYVTRGDAGVPRPLGEARLDPRSVRAVRVWDAQQVRDWHAARPGKGGRPRKLDPGKVAAGERTPQAAP